MTVILSYFVFSIKLVSLEYVGMGLIMLGTANVGLISPQLLIGWCRHAQCGLWQLQGARHETCGVWIRQQAEAAGQRRL